MSGDDDAFSWEGDEPSRSARPAASAPPAEAGPALPKGFAAVGRGADAVGRVNPDGTVTMPGDARPLSNALLVTLGVLGGVYLLFTIGWVIGGLRLLAVSHYLVTPAGGSTAPLWQAGAVLATVLGIAAPLVWFVATLVLTRTTRPWVRIVALVVGVVLLAPWPFIAVGAAGS